MSLIEAAVGWLPRQSMERPRRTLALMALVVVCALPGLFSLELQTDGRSLVPASDPVLLHDRSVAEHFGLRDPIVVLLQTSRPEGIYATATLRRLADLTDALARLPGLGREHVMSLATEPSDRAYSGTFKFRPLLDPLPDTPELLARLKADLQAISILEGTLVSADHTALTVLVGVPPDADRTAVWRNVVATSRPFATDGDEVFVVGAPVAESILGIHILEDLAVLIPLSVALIAAAVWVGCRRVSGVVLALANVGACLVFTLGLMGCTGSPVYLTTAILPVILTTIGLADEIHLLWHYQRKLEEGGGHGVPLRRTYEEMLRPILYMTITTAVGFASFITSTSAPVRSLGLFTSAGFLFSFFWSMTVTPAFLALLPPRLIARRVNRPTSEARPLPAVLAFVLRHRRATLWVLLLVTLGSAAGIPLLQIQDSWVDSFARNSPFRRAVDHVNEKLYGTHTLLAVLEFEHRGGGPLPRGLLHEGVLLDPALFQEVQRFEEFLRRQPGVGGVLGLASHLSALSFMTSGRQSRTVVPSVDEVERLVRFFDTTRGAHRRREVVDDELRQTVVTILLKDANFRDTATLMAAIRAYEKEHLAPAGATLSFAGDVAVSQAMIPSIVQTQMTSVLGTLVVNFFVLLFLFRSLREACWCALPSTLSVAWVLGWMGFTGMPLGVATSMFCAIALGIAVDYAIHLMERVRAARARGHADPVVAALAECAAPITTDAMAIALGFGLLLVSKVPANARLGALVALSLLSGCVLTLGGLGAALRGRASSR